MKILIIGCVKFSLSMLSALIENKSDISGVITDNDSRINSDYADLQPLCVKYNIPVLVTSDINSMATLDWIKELSPDVIFCLGWSRLIKTRLLQVPPVGVIGYHPSELPKNRGRHPLIWALVLGLKNTASTFFFIDEGVDSGDIISQYPIEIDSNDDAASLYDAMTTTARKQIIELVEQLEENSITRSSQDLSCSNIWRKRGVKDGEIDWRMSADSIHNLVRGLTKPYVGAHIILNEKIHKVWKTRVLDIPEVDNIEPGKILDVYDNDRIVVKCGQGSIEIVAVEPGISMQVGKYL